MARVLIFGISSKFHRGFDWCFVRNVPDLNVQQFAEWTPNEGSLISHAFFVSILSLGTIAPALWRVHLDFDDFDELFGGGPKLVRC